MNTNSRISFVLICVYSRFKSSSNGNFYAKVRFEHCRLMSQRLAFAIWDEEKRLLQAPSCNPRPAYPLETASETSTGQRNIGKFIRSSRTPVRFILAKRRKLGKAQPRCRRKPCQSRTAARCL